MKKNEVEATVDVGEPGIPKTNKCPKLDRWEVWTAGNDWNYEEACLTRKEAERSKKSLLKEGLIVVVVHIVIPAVEW